LQAKKPLSQLMGNKLRRISDRQRLQAKTKTKTKTSVPDKSATLITRELYE